MKHLSLCKTRTSFGFAWVGNFDINLIHAKLRMIFYSSSHVGLKSNFLM